MRVSLHSLLEVVDITNMKHVSAKNNDGDVFKKLDIV